MPRDNWTREQSIVVFNLYCRIPFGKAHHSNPEVIKIANIIGRSPGAVARKLGNFGSLDPKLKSRGVGGLPNRSHLDEEIWNEFTSNWEDLAYESMRIIANLSNKRIEEVAEIDTSELPLGKEREVIVKIRINQSFFRSSILASYNYTCCITGIQKNELLIAGHIKPWKVDEKNRLNPQNGIAINGLHDKAFETGLITITPDFIIKISSLLKKQKTEAIQNYFLKYDNQSIILPSKFLPDKEFLQYHNDVKFKP